MRILLATLCSLALTAQAPATSKAEEKITPALPQLTEAQCWNRAGYHVMVLFSILVAHARENGRSLEDLADFCHKLLGPGWVGVKTPKDMLAAVHANFTMYPKTTFEVLESSDAKVRCRASRSYVRYFGKEGAMFGVKAEDFERLMALFHKALAAERGMACELKVDGDWLVFEASVKVP